MTVSRYPRVTASTIGQGNPFLAGEGGGYQWRKLPDWYPGNPKYRDGARQPAEMHPANATRTAGRAARKAEYARLRLEEHLEPPQAAERIVVCHSTMQTYEREFKGSLDEIAAQSPEMAALVAAFRQKMQRGEP